MGFSIPLNIGCEVRVRNALASVFCPVPFRAPGGRSLSATRRIRLTSPPRSHTLSSCRDAVRRPPPASHFPASSGPRKEFRFHGKSCFLAEARTSDRNQDLRSEERRVGKE